jgi:membrane associated rhomboid family serine protease
MKMPVRASLWTLLMAFFGFLFANRGLTVVNSATIGGAFLGAFVGLLFAIMFERRAKRNRA